MTMSHDGDVAMLDILNPEFRVDSPEVRVAAEAGWWARTPFGIAVLRYQECLALLRDRRLRQGMRDLLTSYGVVSGPFAEWLSATLLGVEGQTHQRGYAASSVQRSPNAVSRRCGRSCRPRHTS